MHLLGYCGRRLVQLIPAVIGITLVAFILLRVMPGDPATLIMGTRGSSEDIAMLQRQLGLDQPLWQQYFGFLYDVVTGSFGRSIAYGQPVAALVMERLPATVFLVLYSTVMAVIISVPCAIACALRKDSLIDFGIKGAFIVALSMPSFWLGILLILLLSIGLGWFPVSGYGSGFFGRLWHLFLPALVIALGTAAIAIRNLRSSILAALTADFVDTARAKGLTRRQVLWRHVLPNALIGTVSVIGVHTSWIIGGTVVIETVFSIPGLGYLLISSIFARDYPMVQGLTVCFAGLVILINLLTDITYALIDPRVSYD